MNVRIESSSLQQFDLLPPSFRYRHRLHRVLCGWVTLVCFLVAILIGISALTVMRTLHANRTNQQIASTAIPLLDLRRDVFRLQEDNNQRQTWCRWVQSTRPDDSMLQVLAAIAAASKTNDRSQTGDPQITIDSVTLRLPIEFPISASKPPAWAIPNLTILARSASTNLVDPWIERLNSFDRITAAAIATDTTESPSEVLATNQENERLRLTATPIATRVQP